ncbi:MAG: Lrp/AsnC family transcriptional regulator [Steroidobacteraceae bacterium]
MHIDETDLRILSLLQRDASASVGEIAEAVGLSQSPCWRRIQRLDRAGVIRSRVAVLDGARLGLNCELFVQVRFEANSPDTLAQFEDTVRRTPEILECHMLMGEVDFLLRVVTRDVQAYDSLLRNTLAKIPGVRSVSSTMTLSAIKRGQSLPLHLLGDGTDVEDPD